MTRRGTIGGLALVALAGCATSPTGVQTDRLEGRWEWRSASGGIAGWTITPATEGYTMELRFANGEARLYRDGTLRGATGFRLAIGREGGSFAGQEVVRFEDPLLGFGEEMGLALPDPDRLVLADGCCDGYAYEFARIAGTS